MILPSKKRVTQTVVALAVCLAIVLCTAGAGRLDDKDEPVVPTVTESLIAPITLSTIAATQAVTEAYAAHASEEVEVRLNLHPQIVANHSIKCIRMAGKLRLTQISNGIFEICARNTISLKKPFME